MTEREYEGILQIFEGILIRHEGENKRQVAEGIVRILADAYKNTEGGMLQ